MHKDYNGIFNYSNFDHPRTLKGNMFLKIDNISMDKFPLEPLLPSGRYRFDVNLTEANRKNVIATGKLYLGDSGHRIEQY